MTRNKSMPQMFTLGTPNDHHCMLYPRSVRIHLLVLRHKKLRWKQHQTSVTIEKRPWPEQLSFHQSLNRTYTQNLLTESLIHVIIRENISTNRHLPIAKMAFVLLIPVTASNANAGAYKTIPMYKIICNEYAMEATSLVDLPNLLSKY